MHDRQAINNPLQISKTQNTLQVIWINTSAPYPFNLFTSDTGNYTEYFGPF